MHPVGTRKRKSDEMAMDSDDQYTVDMTSQKIPTKGESPQTHETPVKRQRVGITAAQKEALIENLQLEITERARKLRANYNIHAQTLRTRIEIRVNRLPLSLRKVTMGELLEKYSTEEQPKPSATAGTIRGNSVPAKETSSSRPPVRAHISSRPVKRTRFHRAPAHPRPLPTTANSRIAPRTIATPGGGRSGIARPAITPGRVTAASTLLNKMVERSTTHQQQQQRGEQETANDCAARGKTAGCVAGGGKEEYGYE
ncbi:hypothetical protein N0V88_006667 [Collariella sp. IMI 366227]|nr:hypothetical protein N0V88_006667 [Collariella sp. IMI 366227]